MHYLPPLRDPIRTIGRRTFDFDRQIVVMGIVNRTPDSFFDQGAHVRAWTGRSTPRWPRTQAGAGWVDIGGVPFSPDAAEVSEAEELDRVVPVVAAVAGRQRRGDLGRHLPTRGRRPRAWRPGPR